MKTIVLQSFRTRDVPDWIARCLDSVESWTARSGFDYRRVGDGIFDLCGREYLARVGDNKRSITNLARLELTRVALLEGYDRAIWFDADIFVFAPDALSIDVTTRYAFSKEAWISADPSGALECVRSINNAAFVFMHGEPDLDFLISTIRHVVAKRDIKTNYQVGVFLLTGLERSFGFELLRTVGMLSPFVLQAVVRDEVHVLERQAIEFCDPIHAANLCFALAAETPETRIMAAMDKLEATRGEVINRFVPADADGGPRPWSRSVQPSPGLVPAAVQDDGLPMSSDPAVSKVLQTLLAENRSFRRSRLLRLGNLARRSLRLPRYW